MFHVDGVDGVDVHDDVVYVNDAKDDQVVDGDDVDEDEDAA